MTKFELISTVTNIMDVTTTERCVLIHFKSYFDAYQLEEELQNDGIRLDKIIPLNGHNSVLAICKNQEDVEKLLKSPKNYGHCERFCVIEDVKPGVYVIELSDVIFELARSLKHGLSKHQPANISNGGVLLIFDDLTKCLSSAITLTSQVEEYLKAFNNVYQNQGSPCRNDEESKLSIISQSFIVTGFPTGSLTDKIQIALQRRSSGGGEVECIHPVGSLDNMAIAIFADPDVANTLKSKGEIRSDKFPGHILKLKALKEYGNLDDQYIEVGGFKKYESDDQTKDKLTINLQTQSIGGGDVDNVIYPVNDDKNIALVKFSDNSVSDYLVQKGIMNTKDGAVIHFNKVISLVKCIEDGVIGHISNTLFQQFPEIKDALNKHNNNKWTCIAENKYFFYTKDFMNELKDVTVQVILEVCNASYTYRQQDIRHPPKYHSSSMMEELAGASGFTESKSHDITDLILDDTEFTLSNSTNVIVRNGDITEETVDVIVNAANGNLDHHGGVAFAIAQRAGKAMGLECLDIIRKRGTKLSVTEFAVTKGYNLNSKHIIHAVGPNENQSGDLFREHLLRTFTNCLNCANSELNAKAIAFPLISSGICGGGVQVCAEEFANALIAFQNDNKYPALMEIRIISNSVDVCLSIQETLEVLKRKKKKDHKREYFESHQKEEFDSKLNDQYHQRLASHEHTKTIQEHVCCFCGRTTLEKLNCDHFICEKCLCTIKKNRGKKKCPKCNTIIDDDDVLDQDKLADEITGIAEDFTKKGTSFDNKKQEKEKCVICMDDFDDDVRTLPCKHKFCKDCIDQAFKVKPVCPSCGKICGEMKGNQPPGTMTTHQKQWDLPDYVGQGTIEINYKIPSGTQTQDHPNPGKRFQGTHRTAYLPNNNEGQHVAKLLRRAFDAGLIFTVGTSTTSGSSNVVTWNDIHHKTNTYGGPERYGYPDPTYLNRVKMELAAKGIE